MDETDLQAIVEAVDEHLAFWNILNPTDQKPTDGEGASLPRMRALAEALQMSSAPLYATQGLGGLRGLVYRALNAVIKIFGRPQIDFNRGLRDYLAESQLVLHALQDRLQVLELENSEQAQEIEALQRQLEETGQQPGG